MMLLRMSAKVLFLLCAIVAVTAAAELRGEKYVSGSNTDKAAAEAFLRENDKNTEAICKKYSEALWNYQTNLTKENQDAFLVVEEEMAVFNKETWKNATTFAWKGFKDDPRVYRWFKKLSVLGKSALPAEKLREVSELISSMEGKYSTAKVCDLNQNPTDNCSLGIEPELTKIMAESRDYDRLQHVWIGWRDATGKQMKQSYLRYIELVNEAARLNGFVDYGDFWRESYESDTFKEDLENLWKSLKPFYLQLHAYVRRKLIQKYPGKIQPNGPIPAHLLGNMWAEQWTNIADVVEPYPSKPTVDVTPSMKAKGFTPVKMFKTSEEFFTSLGLLKMTPEFWEKSIIEKPEDREMVCHASAWDFCDGRDFRIKMCTKVDMEDLITIHHEMGHIEYYLQYGHQPIVFREGANPGFHEAIGDVLALSVATPKHLKEIGLLEEVANDNEADINYLLRMALEKVAFLPFGYTIDLWRWSVFSGETRPEEMNRKWWELRLKNQGLCPPVRRTEEDLDPGSKYHVAADVPYIRYFVSFVIQFQFHKALCAEAGYTGPLHKCDIYRSTKAGTLLSQVLSKGSSIPWREAMSIMTHGATDKMDANGLLEYFDPLVKWLQEQNKGKEVGWESNDPMVCP